VREFSAAALVFVPRQGRIWSSQFPLQSWFHARVSSAPVLGCRPVTIFLLRSWFHRANGDFFCVPLPCLDFLLILQLASWIHFGVTVQPGAGSDLCFSARILVLAPRIGFFLILFLRSAFCFDSRSSVPWVPAPFFIAGPARPGCLPPYFRSGVELPVLVPVKTSIASRFFCFGFFGWIPFPPSVLPRWLDFLLSSCSGSSFGAQISVVTGSAAATFLILFLLQSLRFSHDDFSGVWWNVWKTVSQFCLSDFG
jgi:hypothetical protein